MSESFPIITLITDFGTRDEYVGVLKGVLLKHNRDIVIVDISHGVAPQDIGAAAHILSRSYSYFPEETTHLVVVDPGVGTARHILAMKTRNHYFVGPDNGVFSFLLQDDKAEVHRVDLTKWTIAKTSNTFHGRDIMAPVAAHLAATHQLIEIGQQIPAHCCAATPENGVKHVNNTLIGMVVYVDHFGNLCTNISRALLEQYCPALCQVTLGAIIVPLISESYSAKAPGEYVALFDSHDFLEIAANQGNASTLLGVGTGTEVTVEEISLS